MSDFNKKSELIQAIKDIPYEGRGTKTNKAISEFLKIKILFKSCGWVFYWFSFKLQTLFFLNFNFLISFFFKNLLSTKPLLKPMVTDLMCPLSSSLLLTVRKALSCENSYCFCAMKNLKKNFWYLISEIIFIPNFQLFVIFTWFQGSSNRCSTYFAQYCFNKYYSDWSSFSRWKTDEKT